MSRFLIALALVPFLSHLLRAEPVPTRPTLVRIVVLDTSGSMAGPRIETARKELLEMAKQLPPSEVHPLVVVPFTDRVGDVRTFTDQPALEAYLKKVVADGGTSIALGLERALVELKPYRDVNNICVLLYTDGEDDDQAGILKQEEQLDRLFAERSKHGLHQSVVFCKRWEQANAALLARINKRSHAQVIDAGEMRLQPVTLTPQFHVVAAAWAADQPRTLVIEVQGHVDVKGTTLDKALPALKVSCLNANAQGAGDVSIKPGEAKPTPFTVRLPITPPVLAAGRLDLELTLSQPANTKVGTCLLLPTLPFDRVRLPVTLPKWEICNALSASLVPAKPATWLDPLVRRAAFPVTLTIEVQSKSPDPWPDPVSFQIKPPSGTRIIDGPDRCTFKKPGSLQVELMLEAVAPGASASGKAQPVNLGLVIEPTATPAHYSFLPKEAVVQASVPAPATVTTRVTTRTRSIGAPHWTDLQQGTAGFDVEVEFRVDGPLAPDTELTVQCPAAVRSIQFHPSKIATGSQIVRVHIEADLPPAPNKKTFTLPFQPPRQQGAVQITQPAPLTFQLAGPVPVQLMLSQRQMVPTALASSTADKHEAAALLVVPIAVGLPEAAQVHGLQAKVTSGPLLKLDDSASLDLNVPVELRMKAPLATPTSFFLDSTVEEDLTIVPTISTPAVVGSKQRVQLTIEAPFKRLLFYLVTTLAALLAVFLLARLYFRFHSTQAPCSKT